MKQTSKTELDCNNSLNTHLDSYTYKLSLKKMDDQKLTQHHERNWVMDEKLILKTIGGKTMNLDTLFKNIIDLLGDKAVFHGLHFSLPNGIVLIDSITGYEYEGEVVDGFLIDYVPFDELFSPSSYFAFDAAGLEEIFEAYILPLE